MDFKDSRQTVHTSLTAHFSTAWTNLTVKSKNMAKYTAKTKARKTSALIKVSFHYIHTHKKTKKKNLFIWKKKKKKKKKSLYFQKSWYTQLSVLLKKSFSHHHHWPKGKKKSMQFGISVKVKPFWTALGIPSSGFEFKIVLLRDNLPTKARGSSLHFYL